MILLHLTGFKGLRDFNFNRDLVRSSKFDLRFGKIDGVSFNSRTNTMEISNFINNPVSFDFKEPIELNCIVLGENTQLGQTVRNFVIQIVDEKNGSRFIDGTSIGRKRIITFPKTKTSLIVFRFLEASSKIELSNFGFYLIDENLVERSK